MSLKSFSKLLAATAISGSSLIAFSAHAQDAKAFKLAESLKNAKVVVNSIDLNNDSQSTIEEKLDFLSTLLANAQKQQEMSNGPDTEDH